MPTTVNLSPAQGNASRLLALFAVSPPEGGTPTAEALNVAAQHLLSLHTATSARALILATDGAPNCNFNLDNDTCVCSAPPVFDPNCDGADFCLDDTRTIQNLRTIPFLHIPVADAEHTTAPTFDELIHFGEGVIDRVGRKEFVARIGFQKFFQHLRRKRRGTQAAADIDLETFDAPSAARCGRTRYATSGRQHLPPRCTTRAIH